MIAEYFVSRSSTDGWFVSNGGAGGWDECLYVAGGADERLWTEIVVMSDPSWSIDRLVDDEWIALETNNGVYLNSGLFTAENTIEDWTASLDVRVHDADGDEPACITNG